MSDMHHCVLLCAVGGCCAERCCVTCCDVLCAAVCCCVLLCGTCVCPYAYVCPSSVTVTYVCPFCPFCRHVTLRGPCRYVRTMGNVREGADRDNINNKKCEKIKSQY